MRDQHGTMAILKVDTEWQLNMVCPNNRYYFYSEIRRLLEIYLQQNCMKRVTRWYKT